MVNIPSGFRDWLLVAGVLILAWVALWSKRIFIKKLGTRQHRLDFFTVQIIEKFFSIAIFFIGLLLILQILGLDIVPLITFSGIGAAILGFASKDVVANFFGGLMIYITRPFAVNDYIEIPSKNISGTVEEIGWYLTTIRNLQKKMLYVPNSLFSTELLVNDSRMTHRRIEEQVRFRITEADQAHHLVEEARKLIEHHPEIDQNEPADVFLLSISPYGIVIDVKAYTKTTKYPKFMEIKQDLLLKIHRLADRLKTS